MKRLPIQPVVRGRATGPLALLQQPLSLWGGLDIESGVIVDANHRDRGLSLKGRVVAMREARGSSSSSSALVEAARNGVAPAAIILSRLDPILAIGGLVALELYGRVIPIALVAEADWSDLANGTLVQVIADSDDAYLDFQEP